MTGQAPPQCRSSVTCKPHSKAHEREPLAHVPDVDPEAGVSGLAQGGAVRGAVLLGGRHWDLNPAGSPR